MAHQKMKLKLSAFDHRVLDQAVADIAGIIERTGAKMSGPVPIPTKINRFTVNRSTHVHKESGEAFEIRDHSRIMVLFDPPPETINALSRLNLPLSVDVKITIVEA